MYFCVYDKVYGTNRVVSDDEWDPDTEDPWSDEFSTRAEAERELDDLYRREKNVGMYTRGDDDEYRSRHGAGGSSKSSSDTSYGGGSYSVPSSTSRSYGSSGTGSSSGGSSSSSGCFAGLLLGIPFLYVCFNFLAGMLEGLPSFLLSPRGLVFIVVVAAGLFLARRR